MKNTAQSYNNFPESLLTEFRKINVDEIEALIAQGNSADDWDGIYVKEGFHTSLIRNNEFRGANYIGITKPGILTFHDLTLNVGIYNSYVSSCFIENNSVVRNVKYLHGYHIASEVILFNIEEMMLTEFPKYGYGVVQNGEPDNTRIALEICNENAGRQVLPFAGMLAADAFLWSRYREDKILLEKFTQFTDDAFAERQKENAAGISVGSVIKNCGIIKDVQTGPHVYIKGASKLKNLTIGSSKSSPTQIGEGCELVNGIIAEGCRIFYGVKAVRFVMASHSNLKYGARLINAYLGSNSTVSCCEVLNSLIYPGHEQHHNNSFLCAALIMGQSNMAAAATIGSNHNSRSPDGELVADRGFWPGLSVSLKHNSIFSTYNLIAKGNYPYEISNPFPFSLLVNDERENKLKILPGYWFIHNLYALARNSWKLQDRDKRSDKRQHIEYNFLAPDTVSQMLKGLFLLEKATEQSYVVQYSGMSHAYHSGADLLERGTAKEFQVYIEGIENSKRETEILKPVKAYQVYKEMIDLFCVQIFLRHPVEKVKTILADSAPYGDQEWVNAGGQLISASQLEQLRNMIHNGAIGSWEELHAHYYRLSADYETELLKYAAQVYAKQHNVVRAEADNSLRKLMIRAIQTREWMCDQVYQSRAKDYQNPFRKSVYRNEEEMNAVLGALASNGFIEQVQQELQVFTGDVIRWMKTI